MDIREHYERKLERANNLYMELSAIMLQLEMREKELIKYASRPLSALVDVVYPSAEMYILFHVAATQNWQMPYSFTQHSLGPGVHSPCPWGGFQLSGVATELVLGEHELTAICHFTLLNGSEKGAISRRAGYC